MILEIFLAAVHSVGTAITMTAAGVYLHRRKMITTATKTGMARYTQQIAIPALFFSKIVDCPQNFSQQQCPNILDHLNDAWVLLVWPFYVLGVGLIVGKLVIHLVKPPKWQHNCVLAATAFANAMGMPITLLDVIGHNFQPPGNVNHNLDPSMFQSIYVILNPVLQWGLGGWLLSHDEEDEDDDDDGLHKLQPTYNSSYKKDHPGYYADEGRRFPSLNRYNLSGISLEDAGFNSVRGWESQQISSLRRNLYSIPSLEDAGSYSAVEEALVADERTGLIIQTTTTETAAGTTTTTNSETDDELDNDDGYGQYTETPLNDLQQSPHSSKKSRFSRIKDSQVCKILTKIASKAMQPPAMGAMAGFVVASYTPLRGLFVDLNHRADNAPLEWIFDGILTLANSAIPVNMCVVGVNLSIAASSSSQQQSGNSVDTKTIVAVVAGKMLIMPLIGIVTVYVLKTWFWDIPEQIQFQFYLVLLMNFITPTANVVMVIAELGSGTAAKNVMASLIGCQYLVAPFLLSLTVMMVVWMAVL